MKNQSGTIKTNLELYRVVMGGSGGYRRLTVGSDDFLLQTYRQTDTSPLYIYHHHHHHLQPSAEDSTSTLWAQQATGSHSRATRIGQRRLPQVRRQPFAHMDRLFSLDFDLIASWTWSVWSIWRRTCLQIGRRRNPHDQMHNHCTDVVAAPRRDSERAPNMKLVMVNNWSQQLVSTKWLKLGQIFRSKWCIFYNNSMVVSNAWPPSIRLILVQLSISYFFPARHMKGASE